MILKETVPNTFKAYFESLNTKVLSFLSRRFSKTKKAPGVASSGLEMFLNRQPRMNAAAYSQNLSLTGDPHESPENHSKSPNLSVDLNSDLNSEGKKIITKHLSKWFQ